MKKATGEFHCKQEMIKRAFKKLQLKILEAIEAKKIQTLL
jgi:hypothetical protein